MPATEAGLLRVFALITWIKAASATPVTAFSSFIHGPGCQFRPGQEMNLVSQTRVGPLHAAAGQRHGLQFPQAKWRARLEGARAQIQRRLVLGPSNGRFPGLPGGLLKYPR